jgi:ABC-type polar amino acid transport system ATPase subunit
MTEPNTPSPPEIELAELQKRFGQLEVLKGVNLTVARDTVTALIGPSGSGKSTLLRCINLLEQPTAGRLSWRGEDVPYQDLNAKGLSLHRRRFGMAFQHFNLFRHRKIVDNVAEGRIAVLGEAPATAREHAMGLLEKVGIADKADAWPAQLSGGQQQRVGIARAMAMEPTVLLLDEITSALDIELVAGINDLVMELTSGGMTTVIVTHDLPFAARVADRVAFLADGLLVEEGTPEAVLGTPTDPRTREFMDAYSRAFGRGVMQE